MVRQISEFVEKARKIKNYPFRQFIYVKLRTAVDRCKNLLFTCKTHKSRRKTQNSFVPYLTSACPALLLWYPVCALSTVRLRCTQTTATCSPPFLCRRQRSGRSPIIQGGKLVGAVTHVLVNDPTTGYGIFIENMLDAAA